MVFKISVVKHLVLNEKVKDHLEGSLEALNELVNHDNYKELFLIEPGNAKTILLALLSVAD